ncbi:hypothetical protein B0T25DRAFT_604689, partial [Lasiosphaeria hispida]
GTPAATALDPQYLSTYQLRPAPRKTSIPARTTNHPLISPPGLATCPSSGRITRTIRYLPAQTEDREQFSHPPTIHTPPTHEEPFKMEGGWANYTGLSYSGVGYHNQNNRGSEHGNRRALTAEENYPNRGSRYDPSNDENELHHCDSSNEDEDQLHRRGTQRPASPHPLGPLDFSNSPDGGSPAGNDRHHQKKVGGKTTGNAKTDCVKTGRRRKDARDREDERHVWSDYEMQTVLALICKGVHLQPGGTLTFATQLNEALNGNKGNCLDNDIDLQDVETLLNWVYQKKRGALKFIERQKPQRLTRLATRVFSRNLPFDGSKKEWLVEGRRDQEAAERSEKFRRLRREEDGATIPRKGRVLENYPSNGAAQFRRMYEGGKR